MTVTRRDFPADFIFGAATSAFQIEGFPTSDGGGQSIWDTFCRQPGAILDGSNGDLACDHYHLWPTDLELMSELGLDAYRFSVSWSRLQPKGKGPLNPAALDFYDRLIDGLGERNIQADVTLYHWELPQALEDAGGWPNRDTAYRFRDFAQQIGAHIAERCSSLTTLNEPACSSLLGYDQGVHAPGLKDRRLALAAVHHLLLGHGLSVQAMRESGIKTPLGIVMNFTPAYAATPEDEEDARFFDGYAHRWFYDPVFKGQYPTDMWEKYGDLVPNVQPGDLKVIQTPLDLFGLNYYTRSYHSKASENRAPDAHYTGIDWEVYPQGLTDVLLRLSSEYQLPPIYISENGSAYPDELMNGQVHDHQRLLYLQQHLKALLDAMKQGVDVRGYFVWSLMDNFEWAFGYTQRFGLFYVDYATQQRYWKDSARWYQTFLHPQG